MVHQNWRSSLQIKCVKQTEWYRNLSCIIGRFTGGLRGLQPPLDGIFYHKGHFFLPFLPPFRTDWWTKVVVNSRSDFVYHGVFIVFSTWNDRLSMTEHKQVHCTPLITFRGCLKICSIGTICAFFFSGVNYFDTKLSTNIVTIIHYAQGSI